jgi:hypothetical protein
VDDYFTTGPSFKLPDDELPTCEDTIILLPLVYFTLYAAILWASMVSPNRAHSSGGSWYLALKSVRFRINICFSSGVEKACLKQDICVDVILLRS